MSTTLCEVCGQNAQLKCSACNEVYYCNKEHQKQDWKRHKNICVSFKVQIDPILGRHLIATRNIKAGEIIMKRLPLILGPKMVSVPLCLGCHKKLNLDTKVRYDCSKCRWPLCNKFCEQSPLHLGECEIFANSGFIPTIKNDNVKQSVYSSIVPLRAFLLKLKEPKKFDILMECQSHLEEHQKTQIYQILKCNLVPFFINVLKLNTNAQEILNFCSIFDTNSFDVRDSHGTVNIRGLYPTISLLSHDCKHNTKHCFYGDDFQLIVTSTVPIKKGDLITTTYTQTLWGTMTRRAHLKLSKHFDCLCNRCKDPTEFGTFAGAIYCTNCADNESKLISCDPLDSKADWKCENCGYIIDGEEMLWGNEVLKKEIAGLDKTKPEAFEDFLVKYQNVLHPKNSFCLEVKYALSQMYGNMDGFKLEKLSDELVDRKIQLCHELLDVADILEPGYSRFRGLLLYDLTEALIVKAKRDFSQNKIEKEKAQEIFQKSKTYLTEAAEILKMEPGLNEILQRKLKNQSEDEFTL